MVLKLTVLLVVIAAVSGQEAAGRSFRFSFMDNFVDCPIDRPVDIYICNKAGQATASVQVTIPYYKHEKCAPTTSVSIGAGQCQRVQLCDEIRHTYADGSLANKVISVESSVDIEVTGFNVEKFSADSWLILPSKLAGQTYYVLSYTLQHIQTQFQIVAQNSVNKTNVRISIPNRPGETITVDYNGLRYSNGNTLEFTLDPSTSFLSQSAGDLSGVLIQTSLPVAVFTGNVRTWNDFLRHSRDHLVEQVPSLTKWGKDFVYVPTPRANPGDIVRILSRTRGTTVDLIDSNSETISRRSLQGGGKFIELSLNQVTHIKASHAVLVAVIVRSQEGKDKAQSDPADPSLYFLPATNQYSNDFYFPAMKDANEVPYPKTAVIVSVQTSDLGGLRIDGSSVDTSGFSRPTESGSLPYSAGTIIINGANVHRITNTNSNAKMMVIGYGATDRESFASTLGLDFDLDCDETVMEPGDGIDNDCDGLVDEELCGNALDDDQDGLVDEDCTGAEAVGSEFAICFETNIVLDTDVEIDQIELYISALEDDTVVNVTSPAYNGAEAPQVFNRFAPMNEVVRIPLDPGMRVNNVLGSSTNSSKGIRVSTNKNIVLYGINKKEFSTDGFLALPTSVIGSDYLAYCNFPINRDDDRCQFAAVAIEDDTDLVIEFPVDVFASSPDGRDGVISGRNNRYNISSYQVLEIQSDNDITGARIYSPSGKRFSFFSGNVRTRVPLKSSSRDHLVEQLPPVDTWGQKYSSVSTPRERSIGDIWKVIAYKENTHITEYTVDGEKEYTLPAQGFKIIEPEKPTNIYIVGNKPIMVIQISQSATDKDTDPASMLIPPESQWSANYRFVTPLSGQLSGQAEDDEQLPFNNSIMVVIDADKRAGLRYLNPFGETIILGSQEGWSAVPGSNNEGIVYSIPSGQSTIKHIDEDVTFMAVIFGRADRETYGNAIGLRLSRDAGGCTKSTQEVADGIDNDCDGTSDEEQCNDLDDDLDGLVDEDCGASPAGFKYWLVFEENIVEFPRNYALEIYVGNAADKETQCRLTTPDSRGVSYDQTVTMPVKGVCQFAVSAALRATGSRLLFNAIAIECNDPVTVMGVNKETYSNDAFLAFEEATLGTEYYTLSYSPATIQTQFAVLAVKEGLTAVVFSFSATVVYDEKEYRSMDFDLQQHELFQAQSDDDLTGSKITSDKPVAVYSGNIRAKVQLSGSRDHLASQIPPTSAYGSSFNIAPIFFRTVGDVLKVVASSASTRVSYLGQSYNLGAGQSVEIEVPSDTGAAVLTSNNDVLVMQIMKSQNGARNPERADPCFIQVAPTDQYSSKTALISVLYSEGNYQVEDDYNNTLTIIYPRGESGGLRINDERLSQYIQRGTRQISGSNYDAVDLELIKGGINAYVIEHTGSAKFSGYLIGRADRESYCVTAGLDIPNA